MFKKISYIISIFISILLIFQIIFINNSQSIIITHFSDGELEKDIIFLTGGSNWSTTISLPHDCHVDYARINITGLPLKIINNTYPIEIQIDIGKDYTIDWAFNGNGYGAMSHQTFFEDEDTSKEITFNTAGSNKSNNIILPKFISVNNAFLDIESSISRSLFYDKIIRGEAPGWEIGKSVACAGDVNGDGFSDIIFGTDDDGSNNDTFLCYGSSTGISSSPNATLSISLGDDFGFVVSSAGDVNNDGYDDVMVNNKNYNDYTGKVRIYHGSQNGIITSPTTTLIGQATFNHFGYTISSARDVNGDGYSDIIIGAPYYNSNQGRAYVYYGSASGITSGNRYVITGEFTTDRFGVAVAGGGDINGDGYSDIIVSATHYPNGGGNGRVYIYYGSTSGITTPPSQTIDTPNLDDLGRELAFAGDVNGDGYSDIILSRNHHMIDLYYGSSSGVGASPNKTLPIDWANLHSIASAGDVENDGYDDILLASSTNNSQRGEVDLYFGSINGPCNKIRFTGNQNSEYFGQSVSTAGDTDNDGYDEILIGAKGAESNRGNVIVKSIIGAVNSSIMIGENDLKIWHEPYTLIEKVMTKDFSNELNQIIQDQDPDIIDQYNNSLCKIPINISSEKGIIKISNLNITYNYTATIKDLADVLNNYLKINQNKIDENGNISIPIKITIASGGIIRINGLFILINEPPYLKKIPSTYKLNEDSKIDKLFDLYDYFEDDYDPDSELIFKVIENNETSIINVSIYNSHYLKVDALNGSKNDNWFGKIGVKVSAADTKGLTRNSNLFIITIKPVNDPPTWYSLPDIHLNEDSKVLNALNLEEFVEDVDSDIDNLFFNIVNQNNSEDLNIVIDDYKNIDIFTQTENFYGSTEVILRVNDGTNYIDTKLYIYVDPINDAPEVKKPVTYFEMDEDTYDSTSINLYSIFNDVDNDMLDFEVQGQDNLEITIFKNNGTVIFKPKLNWNGQEAIIFSANDSEFETFNTLDVKVTPVNDPPETPLIISPSSYDTYSNIDLISFIGIGEDPDLYDNNSNEVLNYTWISNITGIIGYGASVLNITLPSGVHQIEFIVRDSFNIENSTLIIMNIQDIRAYLYGNVIDENGNYMDNVTIGCHSINGIYYNTTSENGSYFILLYPGIYNISASKIGYIQEVKYNYSISGKGKIEMNFIILKDTDSDMIPDYINEDDDNIQDDSEKEVFKNGIFIIIIIVVIIVLIILIFLFVIKPKLNKKRKEKEIEKEKSLVPDKPQDISMSLQTPQHTRHQIPQQQSQYQQSQYYQTSSPSICTNCNNNMNYIQQNQKWYCYTCQKYQ